LTYERLGNELDEDLLVVCREHHQAIHEGRGMSLINNKENVRGE
jgi:hypothetical protein